MGFQRLNCFRLIAMGVIAWGIVTFAPGQVASGQEFRIESQVYVDGNPLPVSQNVTLFSQGYVYDFQMSNDAQPRPLEVVVFDSHRKLTVLLDPDRKIRLEFPEIRLFKILEGVRRETGEDSRTSFLVEDDFTEDLDWSTQWVTLTSPQIVYRYHGAQPKDVSIMPLYFDFLEYCTRLIATDPTKIPPFARIKLNQSLRRLGWFPSEVQISVQKNGLFKQPFEAKSKHVLITELSDKDRERIALAKQQWLQFKSVDLSEYRGFQPQGWLKTARLKNGKIESAAEQDGTTRSK